MNSTETNPGKELVALATRVLYQQGLVDYLGHCSVRADDDLVVIKPKHSPTVRGMGRLTAEQMIEVDFKGQLVGAGEPPPAEVFIHTEIYRARPDVKAVVHTHQSAATLAGALGVPILPLLHIPATFVDADIPTWPCPLLVTSPQRGQELADALADGAFCHLQGHGIVSVADTLQQAIVQAVMLERLAEASIEARRTNSTPRVITAEEVAELRRQAAPIAGRWAYLTELAESR